MATDHARDQLVDQAADTIRGHLRDFVQRLKAAGWHDPQQVARLRAERDEARRALAKAERAERVVGYRKAIADLRTQSDKTTVDAGTPAIWVAFASAADWLESRLTEGPNTDG